MEQTKAQHEKLKESEFVGVDDMISQVIWTWYFLEAQNKMINDNIVYQDNQSAIKLEKNGTKLSGKCTRHINICYFFVTDRISADRTQRGVLPNP
jgi:hypothetical protein